jgi:hypothetical protein
MLKHHVFIDREHRGVDTLKALALMDRIDALQLAYPSRGSRSLRDPLN